MKENVCVRVHVCVRVSDIIRNVGGAIGHI